MPGKYTDSEVPGLYLEVGKPFRNGKPGTKFWRLKYRLHGKENRFSIGTYPAIKLKHARELALAAKAEVANGVAPLQAKVERLKAQRLLTDCTFQYVAQEWLQFKACELVERSLSGFEGALNNHVYPLLGEKPVATIKLGDITTVISRLRGENKMAMAKRVRTIIRAILGFAEGRGWVERNVALSNSEELKIKHVVNCNAAIEKPNELGKFLVRLDACDRHSVGMALRLLVMLPSRPGELAAMRWENVDLKGADWRYVVGKTKHVRNDKHIVPLPTQALGLLCELHKHRVVNAQGQGWVFRSPISAGQAITEDALLKALHRLWPERQLTAHGFRATYRTLAHEHLAIDPIVLELSLSHKMPGALGAVYARAQLLEQRRLAAQRWADYLDQLRVEAKAEKERPDNC